MSNSASNQPSENTKDEAQKHPETSDTRTVNVMDLVYTAGTPENPEETYNNPGVAPPMLDDPGDLRGDLRKNQ
ncbi:MAG TPA: hypothetical protein DDZ80_25665 [Cyanobacteria bacterium UBA8803]|nr:hypothetical protein [Cyanobacteria bacterium UBA9273]HBL61682.1 hypothetical protein [Cyanobacteria bacterium UBA8803]